MFWYIFILIIMMGFSIFSIIGYSHKVDTSNIIMPLSFFALFIFMGFRDSSVGADTGEYIWAFMQLKDADISQIFIEPIYGLGGGYELNLEIGYKIYNVIVGILSNNMHSILIFEAAFILGLLYLLIKKYSAYPFLSIWLYITLGVFQTEMNMSRNAIGILMCYLALGFIKERQPIRYVVYVLLASTFHFSSILFLPLYWIVKYIPLNIKLFKILFLTSIVIGVAFPLFRSSLLPFIPINYQIYALGNTTEYENLILGCFHFLLIFTIYLFTDKQLKDELVKLLPIGSWMFMLDIFFYCIGLNWAVGTRIAGLFGPFLVIYIPNLIDRGIHSLNRRLMLIIFITIICGIQYIIRIHFNNIGTTIPYQFYFI